MRIDRFKVWSAGAALGLLASLACENRAHADDFSLGGTYHAFGWTLNLSNGFTASNEGGGSITTSFLNGAQLPWVYCVNIPDNIAAPGTYNETTVTTTGRAKYGANNLWSGTPGVTLVGGNATIAGQVAYILDHYANAAEGDTGKEEAVQAAVWKTIYGSSFTVQDSGVNTAMNAILTAANGQTAALNSVTWLSPSSSGELEQALVTQTEFQAQSVPEPSTFMIAGLGALGLIGYALRRRSDA